MLSKIKSSRPLRTFVQAFVGVEAPIVLGALANVRTVHDVSIASGLVFAGVSSAVAAGISALMLAYAPTKPAA